MDCGGGGGGEGAAFACLAILFILLILGVFIGIYYGLEWFGEMHAKHTARIWKLQETKKYIVRDLNEVNIA